ncbi:MAG: hypothetical protein ACLR43_02475 [Faecalibacillus faecis]
MYINPFWCGVAATILAELVGIIAYAIYQDQKLIINYFGGQGMKYTDEEKKIIDEVKNILENYV